MRILVVEDEKRLADALCQILSEEKYMTDAVYDGMSGLEYAKSGIYDCIILDVMLPKLNGFEVLSQLRREKVACPVLLLTAKDSIPDKVRGLDLGADDYMTKPFSPDELLARIRVISRRKGEVIINEITAFDVSFSISESTLSCQRTLKSVRLNYKEAEMLKLFMSKPSMIISKEELLTRIWGYDASVNSNSVEAYVSFLRKKLFFVGSKSEIVSYKKLGYRLEGDQC